MFWKEQIMSTLQSEKYLLQKLKKYKYVHCIFCFFFFVIISKKKKSHFSSSCHLIMWSLMIRTFFHGFQAIVKLNNIISLYKFVQPLFKTFLNQAAQLLSHRHSISGIKTTGTFTWNDMSCLSLFLTALWVRCLIFKITFSGRKLSQMQLVLKSLNIL